jgi:ABC-type sugar transport system ATPase subunit
VGIVGLSGSGKSTLVRLLQRLHVPERGVVSIDGVDLAGVDPAWLRPQIGVVPQEVMLFNRSIRDNIALSDPAHSMESIIAAAKLAGAHDFIIALPEAYDTPIGERGGPGSRGKYRPCDGSASGQWRRATPPPPPSRSWKRCCRWCAAGSMRAGPWWSVNTHPRPNS